MNVKQSPLFLLLSAALAMTPTGAPVYAQTVVDSDAAIVAESTVPQERLIARYAALAGSEAAATDLVTDLRTGGDFTVTEEVTTTTTNPDGSTSTTTSRVERNVANPNGPMGWGEVNITLAMAQKLVDSGEFTDLQSALTGTTSTVTNPDGTTTTSVNGGILAMRADGMGWGKIAQELGFNLGSVMSAVNRSDKAQTSAKPAVGVDTKVERGDKPAAARTERPTKVERVVKVERPERPAKLDRPERPERPQKPERVR